MPAVRSRSRNRASSPRDRDAQCSSLDLIPVCGLYVQPVATTRRSAQTMCATVRSQTRKPRGPRRDCVSYARAISPPGACVMPV